MEAQSNNLLLSLHKWAAGQDENFTTEAFVHLLRHLLIHEPASGITILKLLTGGALDLRLQDAGLVKVTTQVTVAEGRPDIEIRTPDHLIYVEVKVRSGLGFQQLERYRTALMRSGFKRTTLVFLTHYPEMASEAGSPDAAVRWYQIADWLGHQLVSKTTQQPSTKYLIEQFLGYLRGRGMLMDNVNEHLSDGVQSLRSLVAMMGEAVASENVSYRPAIHWYWIGYDLEGHRYNVNVHFANPTILRCNTFKCRIDEKRAAELGFGRTFEDKRVGWRWENQVDLASEEIGFFALPKADQLQYVERFVRLSLRAARDITVTSPPEEVVVAEDGHVDDDEIE